MTDDAGVVSDELEDDIVEEPKFEVLVELEVLVGRNTDGTDIASLIDVVAVLIGKTVELVVEPLASAK
jgi:hypothetical protein